MATLPFRLVDVFAAKPLSGNGLTVIVTEQALDVALMQALTIELRQFETIFLTPTNQPRRFRARVFTMEEELDFAGHPVIGAAAVLHEVANSAGDETWTIELNQQSVQIDSHRTAAGYEVAMHQAAAVFGGTLAPVEEDAFLTAFGLGTADRDSNLPLQIVSTGLPYLILPLTPAGLERASIQVDDLEARLARVGAKFAYLLDTRGREGRTWDNLGKVEDIATGSAAGPVAGYLVARRLAEAGDEIIIHQGRFVGRPSMMRLRVEGGVIILTGDVQMIARGEFDAPL